jgi:methionine-rich copper-binding protein CopC
MLLLFFPGMGSGVAAQGAVARAEPAAGAVLDKPPSGVELWLEEPPSAPGDAQVQVVHNQSGRRVDLGGPAWDAGEPGHLKVQLRPDLGPGKYVVSWAMAEGGREDTGSYSFTVSEPSNGSNDDLVTIALATFGAAGAAVVVGLVAYVLRVRFGLVKAPPPPEEGHSTR